MTLRYGRDRAATLAAACTTAAAVLPLAIGASAAHADVTLPALFSPNLVLERDVPLRVWGKADIGEHVSVSIGGRTADATAGQDGTWEVRLKSLKAGGPYTLKVVGKNRVLVPNVLVGEVWVCSGQSNMEWPLGRAANGPEAVAASADPQLRLFHVPRLRSDVPVEDVKAAWQECGPETVRGFSAVGYFFGRDLRRALRVPVGLIESDWGGTPAQAWTRPDVIARDPELKRLYADIYPAALASYEKALADYPGAVERAKAEGKPTPARPNAPWKVGELYNGMIAPLTRYAIKGAIWYQGESNANNAVGYRSLFPAMIQNWRDDFGVKDFPFLLVQLAPYSAGNPNALNFAELRESQLLTTQTLPKVGMAVITDVGELNDIHPKRKEPVGVRLALLARRIAYGQKVVASGPTYKSLKVEEGKALVKFDDAGDGLEARGGDTSGATVSAGTLSGFTVAGADGVFVPAEARIVGKDTVEVSSPQVPQPVAVRYGFINFPVVNLWNVNGLPASPFRTDVPPPTGAAASALTRPRANVPSVQPTVQRPRGGPSATRNFMGKGRTAPR
jgi:sialate O-acetylesterase